VRRGPEALAISFTPAVASKRANDTTNAQQEQQQEQRGPGATEQEERRRASCLADEREGRKLRKVIRRYRKSAPRASNALLGIPLVRAAAAATFLQRAVPRVAIVSSSRPARTHARTYVPFLPSLVVSVVALAGHQYNVDQWSGAAREGEHFIAGSGIVARTVPSCRSLASFVSIRCCFVRLLIARDVCLCVW